MNLEDQVCSLELSMKLKNLCVKQESLFYWIVLSSYKKGDMIIYNTQIVFSENGIGGINFSAFTVSELGEMLPKYLDIADDIYKCHDIYYLHYEWKSYTETCWDKPKNVKYCISYKLTHKDIRAKYILHEIQEDNEANARAQMLIYLIKNKLMEI